MSTREEERQMPTHDYDANLPPLPQYSASERPVTKGDRIAFQVWVVFFLLTIAFTLLQFLITWLV
jgi:hypothetical protein